MTSINDESLSADEGDDAISRLMDFMQGVEEGDKLEVEYLRDGNVGKVEVEPRVVEGHSYAWFGDDTGKFNMPHMPDIHAAPNGTRRTERRSRTLFRYRLGFAGCQCAEVGFVQAAGWRRHNEYR
jgi:hypothetical protein